MHARYRCVPSASRYDYELEQLLSAFGPWGGLVEGGVDQRGCHCAGRFCRAGIVIHPGRDAGPVVQEHELSGELFRVASLSLFREVQEQRPQPGAVVLSDLLDAASLGRLGAGTHERAPTEARFGKRKALDIEYPEKPLPRRLVASTKLAGHAVAIPLVASYEI